MKKLLILFCICSFVVSAAFAQDDVYYNGDQATVTVQATVAPPPLPDYVQPPCPGDGYLWTPGYWAWGTGGYYWIPGVWVMPPSIGLLWTPPYWGFYGGYYGFHHGYWGNEIGFYGGVNYGFGYYGHGFSGGRWEGGHFRYNTAVWHGVNPRIIHNTYVDRNVIVRGGSHRASFNGPRGVNARPETREEAVMHGNHTEASREQLSHEQSMGGERGQFHSSPKARPAVHSMSTPNGARFNQHGRPAAAPRGGGNGGGGHSGGGGKHR